MSEFEKENIFDFWKFSEFEKLKTAILKQSFFLGNVRLFKNVLVLKCLSFFG